MSLNTAQLWQSIQENGIATAAQCREWASIIVESAGAGALNDPQLLLAQLIKLKKITPFQANAFLTNSLQTLTIGRHRLLAPLTSPALTNWFEAIDPASNAARWIYAISFDRLQSEELIRHPPSLLYSKKQASVKGDSLQSMSPPAMFDGYLLVAATPASGKPLRDEMKNYRHSILPNEKAMKIVYSLAVGLADLHDQGVVHGRIGIDQVWWDGANQVTLLRDPFFPPVSPLTMDVPVAVGVANDQDFRIRYAAPEFTAPAQQPTPATDIYSLGCLWWEMISGRLPFWDTMLDKVPTSACMFPLVIPQDVKMTQGQRKCFEYLLAKTPSTRFKNGRDFLNAFNVVVPREWIATGIASKPTSPVNNSDAKPPDIQPEPVTKSILTANEEPKLDSKPSTVPPTVSVIPSVDVPTLPLKRTNIKEVGIVPVEPLPKKGLVDSKPLRSAVVQSIIEPASKPDLTTKFILPPPQTKQDRVVLATKEEASTTAQPNAASPSTAKPSASSDIAVSKDRAKKLKPEKLAEPVNSTAPASNAGQMKIEPMARATSMDSVNVFPLAPLTETPVVATATTSLLPESILNPIAKPINQLPQTKAAPRKKKKKPVWLLPFLLGGSLACLSLLGWLLLGSSNVKSTQLNAPINAPTNVNVSDSVAAEVSPTIVGEVAPGRAAVKPRQEDPLTEQFVFAVGENSFPWLPPRATQPFSLEMLPPGLQGLLIVRPKVWQGDDVGVATSAALSPTIAKLWDPIQKATGIDIADTQQVAIGLYGGREDGWPEVVYRIKLYKPKPLRELKPNWQTYAEQSSGEKNHIWTSGSEAIFTNAGPVDEDREISQFTWGPINLIRDLADADGGGSAITRSLEYLWKSSDSQSDFSLLVSTSFLFSTSRNLLPLISPRLSEFLRDMVSEKTLGLAFSTTLDKSWYGELRFLGRESAESAKLLEDMRTFAKGIANDVESTLVETSAQEYWRALALRYPQMLRALTKHLRFGLENGQIVTNFYLPKTAAPNLAIATWMMLQPSSFHAKSASVASSGSSKPSPGVKPTSFALLEHPVTITFEQEPLDSALSLLGEELNSSLPKGVPKVSLTIDGKAFELSSVTRNQQIRGFKFTKAPLRSLLTDLASRVNPDKTISTIKDPKQSVVWILGGSSESPEITFTTRRGIEGTNKKLPEEFQGP